MHLFHVFFFKSPEKCGLTADIGYVRVLLKCLPKRNGVLKVGSETGFQIIVLV